MRRLFRLVFLLAVAVGCYQPSPPSIAQPASPSPKVAIKIKTDRHAFTVGEMITITMTIKNLKSQYLDAPETYWSASVVLDEEEFKRLPEHIGTWNGPGVILRDGGQMRTVLTLSDYGVSQRSLTVGEHSLQVKIGDVLSNALEVAIRPPDPTTLIGQTEMFTVHGIAPPGAIVRAGEDMHAARRSIAQVQLVTATHRETGAMHILAFAGAVEQLPTRGIRYRHSILTGVVLQGEYLFIATLTADGHSRKTPPWSCPHQRGEYATRVEVIGLSDLRHVGTGKVPVAPTQDDGMSAFKGGVLTAFGTGVRLEDWRIDIDADGMIVVRHVEDQNDAR